MSFLPLSELFSGARLPADVVAFDASGVKTFAEFELDVARAALRLRVYSRAALVCADSYHFAVGLFGLLYAGCHVVLPQNVTPGGIAEAAANGALIVDDAFILSIQGAAPQVSRPDPFRLSMDFFTSGTTGAATCIVKNLAMLETEVSVLDKLWGNKAGGDVFATVSHHHIFGLTFKILWALASGRPFCRATHFLWEGLVNDLTSNSFLISSPAHLSRLGGLPHVAADHRPAAIFSAGALLPEDAKRQAFETFGVVPIEIFGSTETGAIASRAGLLANEAWRPLPGIRVVAVEGCLRVRTPFAGDGWLETSDLISVTDEGFTFEGRADRVVKVEGKRISLNQVEDALASLPEVARAAVIALPGHPLRVAAAVSLSEEGKALLLKHGAFRFGRALRSALSRTQEVAGLPRSWKFVDKLPDQPLGKRRQTDILALFRDDREIPVIKTTLLSPHEAEIDLNLMADLPAFRGHFPENPVLPGVVQIDWAIRLARQNFGIESLRPASVQVKFLKVIVPNMLLSLHISFNAAKRRLAFSFRANGDLAATGTLTLKADA